MTDGWSVNVTVGNEKSDTDGEDGWPTNGRLFWARRCEAEAEGRRRMLLDGFDLLGE